MPLIHKHLRTCDESSILLTDLDLGASQAKQGHDLEASLNPPPDHAILGLHAHSSQFLHLIRSMPNFLSVLEGAKSQENHSSLLVKAVELLANEYRVALVLGSLLGRPWAALLLLSL
jgi:hypothetical protein